MSESADDSPRSSRATDRWRATLAVLPFLALGIADVALIVRWGHEPKWATIVLPPILFVTIVGWITFASGFHLGPEP